MCSHAFVISFAASASPKLPLRARESSIGSPINGLQVRGKDRVGISGAGGQTASSPDSEGL